MESFTATHLTIIGGNQSNAVTRLTVERTGPKSQVLGYRRPVSNVVSAKEIVSDVSMRRKIVGGATSLGLLLLSVKEAILGFVQAVGEYAHLLPETAASASVHISTGQSLAVSANVPWPATAGLLVVVCTFAFGAYDTWNRKRKNSGTLTKAPYGVEPETEAAGEVSDVFAAPAEAVTVTVPIAGSATEATIEALKQIARRERAIAGALAELKPRRKPKAKPKAPAKRAPKVKAKAKVRA